MAADVVLQSKSVSISSNGSMSVTPTPSGYGVDAFSQVDITTSVSSGIVALPLNVTENGVYTPVAGVQYSKVTVDVDGGGELEELSVTANGVYEPTGDVDGYNKVTVDVEPTEEEKEELRQEGKDAQLVVDKAAVAAASPITANGTTTILDTDITVNVPSDPDELAAAKEEGKTEQLTADKAEVAAVPTIVENGTTTVLGEDIVVNVPNPLDTTYVASKEVEIAVNGEQVIEAAHPAGYDRFYLDKVTIKTNVTPILEDKMIQANGTYTCSAGYEGFRTVVVDVNGAATLEEKTQNITANGSVSILPSTGFTGLSKVDVNVNVQPSAEQISGYKAEQLAVDKAEVAAASPINSNGTKTILGESVVVNVQPSASDIAGYKAEQALADKTAVEALSPITTNGTKTVSLGGQTASVTVNVEGGSSDTVVVWDVTNVQSDITEQSPWYGKTLCYKDKYTGDNLSGGVIFSGNANVNFDSPCITVSARHWLGDKCTAKQLSTIYDYSDKDVVLTTLGGLKDQYVNYSGGITKKVTYTSESTTPNITFLTYSSTGRYDTVIINAPVATSSFTCNNIDNKGTGDPTKVYVNCSKNASIITQGAVASNGSYSTSTSGWDTEVHLIPDGDGSKLKLANGIAGIYNETNYTIYVESVYSGIDGATGYSLTKGIKHICDLDWSQTTSTLNIESWTTEIEGLTGYKSSYLYMTNATGLTNQSLQNIKNTIADVSADTSIHQIKMSSVVDSKYSIDDKAELVAKGWTITVS